MPRVALAQLNPVVGDLAGNASLIRDAVADAARIGVDLVVFPEMMMTGYPIEDLALRPSFRAASRRAVDKLAADIAADGHGTITCVVGYLDQIDGTDTLGRPSGGPTNAAAVITDGHVVARYVKHHLPNYGVFDEYRYFVPGTEPTIFHIDDSRYALAICEDLWRDRGPVTWARDADADFLIVINGSPFELEKDDVRLDLCRRRAAEANCTLIYVNMVGGQDELVFDGDSLVVAADGTVLARAPQFESGLLVVDTTNPSADASADVFSGIAPPLDTHEQTYAALMTGLRDYVNKNGFSSVLLGLSGGIDSALVAAIAADALGAERVFGIGMPTKYSSEHSKEDARDLAERVGLHFRMVDIQPMVDAFVNTLGLQGLAEENVQARVRGTTLMALSNAEGHLVLATGNKSELAVGYSTIYGDAVGGFAPIKDVVKTEVWELARWRNRLARSRGEVEPIPPNSIEKPPSAELRPDQLDTDSLPDYDLLDRLLDDYIGRDASADALISRGYDAQLVQRVLRMVDLAEYKRRQYPPGTKITFKAFGRDRRLPITNRWRERA